MNRFQFISESLNGTGGFKPAVYLSTDESSWYGETHLIQYPRESASKFYRRNQLAWYVSDLMPACVRYAGYLLAKPPVRDISNTLISSVSEDIDMQGSDINVFWSEFSLQAKARGTLLLLVDMPEFIPPTSSWQQDDRAYPYFSILYPENLVSYEIDERGNLSSVDYMDTIVDSGASINIRRLWTKTRWEVYIDNELVKSGAIPFGICPVIPFTETGRFFTEGEFAQMADISKRLFNVRSELDEILRAQTFSLLAYQVPESLRHEIQPSEIAETVGTHNMLMCYGQTPKFIAPEEGPAKVYMDNINILESKLAEIGLAVQTPSAAESGLAMQMRFQALNSSLVRFARKMEELENKAWKIAALWMNMSAPSHVIWGKDYQLLDVNNELDIIGKLQEIGAPDEYIKEKMKTVATQDIGYIDPEKLQKVLDAIEETEFMVEPTDEMPFDDGSDAASFSTSPKDNQPGSVKPGQVFEDHDPNKTY